MFASKFVPPSRSNFLPLGLHLRFTIALAATLLVFIGNLSIARAATLNVPSVQYPTLQSAIDAAQFGDTIVLQAGMTFQPLPNTSFVLRKKQGGTGTDADYITITSSAIANLPAGRRVAPADAASMPRLLGANFTGSSVGPPVIMTEITAVGQAPVRHYKLVGLEITSEPSAFLYNYVSLGAGEEQTDLTQVPHHLVVDRCLIRAGANQPARRGIALNSADTVIGNSYIAGFKEVGVDAQAIAMWNGPGRYLIENNYLEGAAENLIILGGVNSIPNLIPADITIRRNHFFKPLSWRLEDTVNYGGTPWTVKNLLELKTGKRVTIDGNILEQNWAGQQNDQRGYAVGISPITNGSGSVPQLEDITLTNNKVRRAPGGILLDGRDDENNPNSHTWRVTIKDNVFEDINQTNWGGPDGGAYGRLFAVHDFTDFVTIEHNTGFNSGRGVSSDYGGNTHFVGQNNILRKDVESGDGPGDVALNGKFPGAVWTRNIHIASAGAGYYTGHPNNYFRATENDVGFVDYAGGNYRLLPSSVGYRNGTDGKDIGANIDVVESKTAGVISGVWPVPYTGTPITVPATIEAENFDNGGEGLAYHDLDAGNNGGQYRTTDVDIREVSCSAPCPATCVSNGHAVFNAYAGEWLKYTINVITPGLYNINVRYAARQQGGTFHVEVDGEDVTGTLTATSTGDWPIFQSVGKKRIHLTAGLHVLRLKLDTNGADTVVADFDSLSIVPSGFAKIDFDDDLKTDISVWRPSDGKWIVLKSSTCATPTPPQWGTSGDKPVPGDYDGDGKTDIAVFRPSEGNWYYIKSSTGAAMLQNWGDASDKPVPGDYDGDGKTDFAVFRPSEGNWYILYNAGGNTIRAWGANADKPVQGDYDGDGKTDVAVFRPSEGNWYITHSATNTSRVQGWGNSSDRPVPGDYDGDAKTDVAIYRPSETNWYILQSASNSGRIQLHGAGTDQLVPGDYDGDSKMDIAVWRASEANWYILRSTTGTVLVQNLGTNGDVPVSSAYIPD